MDVDEDRERFADPETMFGGWQLHLPLVPPEPDEALPFQARFLVTVAANGAPNAILVGQSRMTAGEWWLTRWGMYAAPMILSLASIIVLEWLCGMFLGGWYYSVAIGFLALIVGVRVGTWWVRPVILTRGKGGRRGRR